MTNELKKIIDISHDIGQCPDLVQGAGGNFSVKTDNQKMFIKASGFRFSDVSENNGLVAVNYNKLLGYYNSLDFSSVFESDGAKIVNSCILEKIGSDDIRPSIETGFHVLLGKYVVHTHSVYTNIIACVLDGENLLKKIFKDSDMDIIFLPYSNPGLQSVLCIKKGIKEYMDKYNKNPEAILIQNHGLIITNSDIGQARQLHENIIDKIKNYFKLEKFPEIKIFQIGENKFESVTVYLKEFIKNNSNMIENISQNILFPDLAVFCADFDKKADIDKKTSIIFYKISLKEALAMEENLVAWAYIINCAKKFNLNLKPISQGDISFINNMESEKYRQKLINN